MSIRIFMAAALLWVGAAGVPDSAHAQSDEGDYQTHLEAGLEAYEGRRYQEAATEFEAAYAIRPEPDLKYNIARSYERALMREEAIAAYEAFLQLPGTTSEMRSRAIAARDSLRAELNAMRAPDPQPDPPDGDGDGDGDTDTDPGNQVTPIQPPPPEPSSGLRTAGIALLAVGAAAAIGGGVCGGLALSANSDFEDATEREDQIRLKDDVDRFALLADVLVGAGVAFAVTGVVLMIVGGSSDDDEQAPVAVAPSVGPGGAALHLRASF